MIKKMLLFPIFFKKKFIRPCVIKKFHVNLHVFSLRLKYCFAKITKTGASNFKFYSKKSKINKYDFTRNSQIVSQFFREKRT